MIRTMLITALGILMCMCGEPGLGTMQQAQNGDKEWTLLFYFSADSGNEGGAIRDINALERGIDSADYNIVVQIDRIPGNDSSNGDWTDCRRFLIEPDPDPDNVIRSTELESIGEVNMGDPQTVADFVAWGVGNYPAERYAVMIWGGAMPNGIAADFSESSPDPIRTIFGELTEAYALATAAIGRRLDLCVLWGCNYGMLENDFVIKEYCDVTARSEIPTNYMLSAATAIPTWLNANPAASAREFGAAWVDGYIDTAVLMGAWASIDLGPGFVDLALAVDTFARELIKAGGITQADIATAMGNTVHCYPMELDINHFAKIITNTAALPQSLRIAAQSVIDAYGYPPEAGKPLANFRFVDGSTTGNEVWPDGDTAELRGTKMRQFAYGDDGYLPFAANNAWHWFLDGETSLPAEPLVTYESNSLGNTIASGPLTILGLTLRNSGGLTATGISGVLSTEDTTVAIFQNTGTFPDIASEATGNSQTYFTVTVDADTPIGHRIWFWLDLSANGGAYTNTTTFCLEVSGCADGETRSCYEGPDGTRGIGVCWPGTQTCTFGIWGTCDNQTLPGTEDCADTLDNDCDDLTDTADPDCAECTTNSDCDDSNVCNGTETCQASTCTPGAALDCDDDNVCTDDSCDPAQGCQYANNMLSCDDGDDCTTGDVCSAGACTGTMPAEICSDGIDNDCDGDTDADDAECDGDSDGDGLPDAWEEHWFGDLTEDASGDPDGDGLDNGDEYENGTDPTREDTDGDGHSDASEVEAGTDPLDPDSHPDDKVVGGCGCGFSGDAGDSVWWIVFGLVLLVVFRRVGRTR